MAFLLRLLAGWAVISACSAAATTMTNLTFFPQKLTWNDAHDACQTLNGDLVQITDEAKYKAVIKAWRSYREGFAPTGIWIGLIAQVPLNFQLSKSCDPVTWTKWVDELASVDWLCVRLRYQHMLFDTLNCGPRRRHFMCEIETDEPCPYTVLPNTTVSSNPLVTVLTQNQTGHKACQTICDNSVKHGLRCWAFHHTSSGRCQTFFAKNPFHNITSSISQDLNIKRCFQGVLGDIFYNTTFPNESKRPTVCVNVTSTGTTEVLTEMSESTFVNTMVSTEETTFKTEEESANVTMLCHCPCKIIPDAQRVQFVKEVVANLTIKKSELSSSRRKRESVRDDRPISTGIGYSGVFLLVALFSLVLISDIIVLFPSKEKR